MTRLRTAALALLLVAPACGNYDHLLGDPSATPTASGATATPTGSAVSATASGPSATLHYALRLRDGGSARATVAYLLPNGERREETVGVPWRSGDLTFPHGAILFVTAAATTESVPTPLLCVLEGTASADGAYTNGRVTQPTLAGAQGASCATEYRLGAWPPPEDDPETGNLLIRVG